MGGINCTVRKKRKGSVIRWARVFLLAGMVFVSGGCMTLDHLLDPEQEIRVYGGTQSSYEYIADDYSPFFGTLIRIIDLPITVVADTLLLPVTAVMDSRRN